MRNLREARTPRHRPASGGSTSATRSDAVVGILSSLRRYARAVTGSRDSGDRYVRQFLEVYISDQDAMADGHDARLQSFMLFHQVQRGLHPRRGGGDTAGSGWIDHELASLPAASREMLLLVHLEDFPVSQAARIIGLSESEARVRLHQARAAFEAAAPKAWASAMGGKTARIRAGDHPDNSAGPAAGAAQRAARQAARGTMGSPAWGLPRTRRAVALVMPRDRDLSSQPDQPRVTDPTGSAGTAAQDDKRCAREQRRAIDVWETDGGTTAPIIVL